MPDNTTLSERLRTFVADGRVMISATLKAEILQALDDKQKLESDLEARTILAGTFLDARIKQLESDNARYRATIVQLETERAEAVERVRVLEAEVRAAEKYRSETGSW